MGAASVVLALVAAVAWQVVAWTARLEPGSVSAWSGAAVASCGIRADHPAAFVVGADDAERRVVYSVRNPNVVPVRLTGGLETRFQAEPYDPDRGVAAAPSDDLVDSVVVPPGEQVLAQVEYDVSAANPVHALSLDLDTRVLGIERLVSVELEPVLLVVPGTTEDAATVQTVVREVCGE